MTAEPKAYAKLPPAADIAELTARGETHRQIAERFGVGRDAVSKAVERGRRRGEIPPAPPREPPTEKKPPRKRFADEVLNHQPQVVRRRPRNAQTMVEGRDLPEPAPPGHPACGAVQLLGTRVCDLPPHDDPRHVGAGQRDPRGEFWGQT